MKIFKPRFGLTIIYIISYFLLLVGLTYSLRFMKDFYIAYILVGILWVIFPFHIVIGLKRKLILNSKKIYFTVKLFNKKIYDKGFNWQEIIKLEYKRKRIYLINDLGHKLPFNKEWKDYKKLYVEIFNKLKNTNCQIDSLFIDYLKCIGEKTL